MKTYRATILYAIKIFGLIVCAGFAVFIISLFINIVSFFIESSFFEKIVISILFILFVIAAFQIIRSNNPSISFDENHMLIGRHEILYSEIENFHPAKGGSEPYITTKSGGKIDLEISWFRKRDRIAIEKTLSEKIKSF
ncbi:hypothetical protein [Aquimarina litoralis]|uniref:hypothetical protein n=1 Tax=Aquimarina litoralis TaxID=584605 RepID=UPI001C55A269|nr:hypothetical protein [Aquimarina litoralis]MBW1298448.1 hypothetical protein [Aquimarina litoralis]